jgi:hypothetical protein
MKKFRVSYKTGRVDFEGYWILPQFVNKNYNIYNFIIYLLKKISDFLKDDCNITVYSIDYGMANTTLAGDKSDVKINHASIASGNLSLMAQIGKKKSILGKKTLRKPEEKEKEREKEKENISLPNEKKSHSNQDNINKAEKSNLIFFDFFLIFFNCLI